MLGFESARFAPIDAGEQPGRSVVRRPNFFIVGAPKCGTTSLATWLGAHPQIFMPKTKEPHFFDTDHRARERLSAEDYEALFADADDDATAIGEASVWYLHSRDAVPAILAYNPDARFIACVRNPIDMAHSLHYQQIYNGFEDIVDFGDAWEAQAARASGAPILADDPAHLLYGPACQLGAQVERLRASVPDDKLRIVFLDDLKADPHRVYRELLAFLEVADFEPDFPVVNQAQRRRSLSVRRAVRRLGRLKRQLGINRGFGILDRINAWNNSSQRWQADPAMASRLRDYFREDIELLADLTGRNLGAWLNDGAGSGDTIVDLTLQPSRE